MIKWNPVIKEFKQEWKIPVEKKGKDVSDMPNISKALPIIKETEYFADFLHQTVGERNIPPPYVIYESDNVHGVAPQIIRWKSYSEDHGSVEKELTMRTSHNHPHFT